MKRVILAVVCVLACAGCFGDSQVTGPRSETVVRPVCPDTFPAGVRHICVTITVRS